MSKQPDHLTAGLLYGIGAYLFWGLVPLYFKQVRDFPAVEVLAHRIVWSVVFLAVIVAVQRRWDELFRTLRNPKTLLGLACSTVLVGCNWLVFIWAVATDRVLQASLGYYINPLLSVLLGMVFLKERLRPGQLVALGLAAIAVATLTVHRGQAPWIALTLAVSFGFYGLLRKVVPVSPLIGLSVETALMLPLGAWFVILGTRRDFFGTAIVSLPQYAWLPAAGLVTAVPLLWFTTATRRLRLSTIGFLQYLSPTCNFVLAVLVFHEPFKAIDLAAFALIWTAVAIYCVDVLRSRREEGPLSVPEEL